MPSPHAAINPRLISIITGQDLETVKEKPTLSMLPGRSAGMVARGKHLLQLLHETNKHYLICGHCGRKGQYDLGLVLFNSDRWLEHQQEGRHAEKNLSEVDWVEYIQPTGYFRCKHCNGAGNWKLASPFIYYGIVTEMLSDREFGEERFALGEISLFDGSKPRWASEGEERLLEKLQEEGQNGYLWNRLGNLYNQGGRPELAVVAFEKSIQVDPAQIESHYSLGDILFQMEEDELAAQHFRMMLVHARRYDKLEATGMRDMLSNGLQCLLEMHEDSDHAVPFLPSREEIAAAGEMEPLSSSLPKLAFLDLELQPDDEESFWPLAEMYMGNRCMEIPASDRTLDKYLPGHGKTMTEAPGSGKRTVVISVGSEEKGRKIAQICEQFGLHVTLAYDGVEDLSGLEEALQEKFTPDDRYSPCPCGSGRKFKFCCAQRMKNFDIDQFIAYLEGERK